MRWHKKHMHAPRIFTITRRLQSRTLEQAQSAEVQAGGDLVSAQAALKVLGISDPIRSCKVRRRFEVPVKAPISGESRRAGCRRRSTHPSRRHPVLHDLRHQHVWVLVNVYQKDLPYVRVGDQVTIQTEATRRPFKDASLMSRLRSIPVRARCRRASRRAIPARS